MSEDIRSDLKSPPNFVQTNIFKYLSHNEITQRLFPGLHEILAVARLFAYLPHCKVVAKCVRK